LNDAEEQTVKQLVKKKKKKTKKKKTLMPLFVAFVLDLLTPMAPWFNATVVKYGCIWTVSGNPKMH
jgi:hypothetical protein